MVHRSDYIEGKTLEQIMEEDPANLEKYMKEFVARSSWRFTANVLNC